jgi:hypothetical protein
MDRPVGPREHHPVRMMPGLEPAIMSVLLLILGFKLIGDAIAELST